MKLLEQLAGFGDGFAFECLGHQRRGGFRNRAANALEGHIGNTLAFKFHIERQTVTAEWVIPLLPASTFDGPEVPRPAIMVENDFLIKIA